MNISEYLCYLVCRHQVDQHCVQQLLRNGVALTDDGAHQIHHVHVHLLVVAVAGKMKRASNIKAPHNSKRYHLTMIPITVEYVCLPPFQLINLELFTVSSAEF